MKIIEFLIGIPASGKSTYARTAVKNGKGQVVRINNDDIRSMIHSDMFSREREKVVSSIRENMIASLMNSASVKKIIVDNTNLNPIHIENAKKEWGAIADIQLKWFDDSFNVDLCHKRNTERSRSVPHRVIENMYVKFIELDKNYRRDEIVDLTHDKIPAIICDIDGTIADHRGIRSPFEWDKVHLDRAKFNVMNLVQSFIINEDVGLTHLILMSGRDACCEDLTKEWLDKYNFNYSKLFMRPEGSNEKDYIIKRNLYEKHIQPYHDVKFAIDDRNQVVRLWRALGIECIQVAPGDF